jgi:hypothetical protein
MAPQHGLKLRQLNMEKFDPSKINPKNKNHPWRKQYFKKAPVAQKKSPVLQEGVGANPTGSTNRSK